MASVVTNYYERLGLMPFASASDIRRAYRDRVRLLHPDCNSSATAEEAMIQLNIAHDALSDPIKKKEYDAALAFERKINMSSLVHVPAHGMQNKAHSARPIPTIKLARSFDQLGLIVSDGSGSMSESSGEGAISKAQAVNRATQGLIERLKSSRNCRNYSLALINFDDKANVLLPITAVTEINANGNYDPQQALHGGGTFIGAGLQQAEAIARTFLETPSEVPQSVVVVVLSDGEDGYGGGSSGETTRIASRLKGAGVTLCTAFFGSGNQEAERLLQTIASNSETGFSRVYDSESLRKFFEASVSAARGM